MRADETEYRLLVADRFEEPFQGLDRVAIGMEASDRMELTERLYREVSQMLGAR